MDSHSDGAQPTGFHPNGLLLKGAASVTRPLDPRRWAAAEGRTAELISRIQPNWTSEKHRNAVASYVQRLIGQCVPCQVFTFGSVPLRTYLPDGDIDLSAFSEDQNVKDNWANSVLDMLRREEMNEHAEFEVKEVNYIQAEVKIIKCLVDNIVVDISFNQLGGLCTLCFLEEVDNLISQNHLFKRSIILIKAWCYYESRILGAHHGLISTYALETLVLYIFHVFNNSFAGPLEVLYRFLEFFSKFDWANFCVSLWGPVPICSLPRMEADPPRKDGAELLLNKMFLNACSTAYSVFPGSQDNQEQPFKSKHFNVVDPLRINNNLGRSVSKGNFYRIRSAFTFGAQKLVRILECQEENIVTEVNQFFVNTWDRHGKGYRPDAPVADLFHLGQANSKHEANCRRSILSESSTENFANQNRQIDESHNSMQPGNFPVNQTAGAINEHNMHYPRQKDHKNESRAQLSSGRDQYFIQRENVTKKQQSEKERTSREKFWQTRRHTIPQFARSSSSPELTSMSSEAVSLRRHNEASGWVKEVTTTRTECNRMARDIEKCFTDDLSSNESLSHLTRCNPESSHPLGCYSSKPVSGSSKSVTSSGDELSQRHQQEQGFMNMHMLNLASHPFVSVSPSIPGSRPETYSSDPPLAPYQQYNHAGSTAEVEIVDGLHNEAISIEDDNLNDDHGFWADNNADSRTNVDHESEDFSNGGSRLALASPANFYGTKGSSETSWDGNSSKMNNAVRYPMTRNLSSSNKPTTVVDNRELDVEPVSRIYDGVDDGSVVPSVTSLHGEVHQLPGFGQAHMRYPNSMLPFAPLLVRPGSQQGMSNNHAVLPITFYPAGPPVPFVTMVPVYNINGESGASGSPASHEDTEMEKPTLPIGQSSHSSDPITEELKQLSHSDSLGSTERTSFREQCDESRPDIFNSDFASHWKNLQYGRLCQNTQLQHPFANPSSVLVPPSHLQGNVPFDVPRSPYPRSSNFFAPLVPVMTPQPGPSKTTSVSRQHGREFPKHRNGTGTYFPNPEVIRDRQFVTSRQYQVDPKHDRSEYQGEREANWNFSWKPRFSGRAHPRYRSDKRNSKIDRSVASSSQTDRGSNTFRKNPRQLDQIPKDPSIPRSTWNKHYHDGDTSVYQTPSDYCDEVSQSKDAQPQLLMLYPYPHNIAYGSSVENLHFGSVGPKSLIGTDTIEARRGYPDGCEVEHQSYQGDTETQPPDYAPPPRFLR